jgi:hypothetical protein
MAKPSKKSFRREAAVSPPAPEPARRVAPRRATAECRLRILERLTTGLGVAHFAHVEGLSVRRIRRIIAEMLASRETDPPAGFVQLQIGRLSQAMIVARTMMMEGDLRAMDRLIRLIGRAPPLSQLRAVTNSRFRGRRAVPTDHRAAARTAAAERRAGRSRGETFPGRKPLKNLKMRSESPRCLASRDSGWEPLL